MTCNVPVIINLHLKNNLEIRQERPVTAEDMANIVADYLAQTGLDEKSRELLKTLCLQLFTSGIALDYRKGIHCF